MAEFFSNLERRKPQSLNRTAEAVLHPMKRQPLACRQFPWRPSDQLKRCV
jgi:hypothetical protein